MKAISSRHSHLRESAGVALFMVLAFLALIIVLMLAMFSSAKTELSVARSGASETTSRQLADTAVQVVASEIKMATSSSSKNVAWASQPGMIRTYGSTDGTASSAALSYFKLYSSDDMEVTASEIASFDLADDVDGQWDTKPAMFTDLNSPVTDSTGKIRFPIIDPRVQTAAGTSMVDGFSYSKSMLKKDGVNSVSVNQVDTGGSGADKQRVPMPVKWIYVLRDGTLTAPRGVDGTGKIANWTGASSAKTPSAGNPIVGRIAFWTDDECCKINVNTASEPTPWDTPRAVCIQDLKYGRYQPANKEFQRYPGHPFMTALSPVFFPKTPAAALTAVQRKAIYDFVPRVQDGGSQGGLTELSNEQVVTPDGDRLFANIDECYFSAVAPSGGKRVQTSVGNSTGANIFTVDFLNQRRFFLTATSRAPEVNLNGRPRISLWPESSVATQRTAYDKLAAYCSSTKSGTYPCFVQRSNSTSPTSDYVGIGRNQQIYSYLQNLTQSAVPGFGGDFKTKWGDDRDQVLTEIFDYIRCVNLRDPIQVASGGNRFADNGQVAPIQIGTTQGFGRYHTISQFGLHFICCQDGAEGLSTIDSSVTKLPAGQRYIEAVLLFEPFSPSLGYYRIAENLFYDVKFTSPFMIEGQDLKMSDSTSALSNGIGNGWHNNGREHGGSGGLRGPMQSFGGGAYKFISKANPRVIVKATGTTGTMSFSGGTVQVTLYSGNSATAANLLQTFTINFPAGSFPVPDLVRTGTDGYDGCGATSADYWWSFKTRYSALGQMPLAPGLDKNGKGYYLPERRFNDDGGPAGFKTGCIFRLEDVVRSMVPDHGDIRLIAAKRTVPQSDFVPVDKGRWSGSDHFLHVFSSSSGTNFLYGFCNEPGPSPAPGIPAAAADDQLVHSSLVNYHFSRLPEIRPGAGKQFNKWNDYDNGVATWTDGSYINKPDEGNQASTSSPYNYFSWNFSEGTSIFFSPSRLVPSAGMLGSLPTGVMRSQPWQTLLFRPDVTNSHPGGTSPKDHLIMDLFWMPVIEPYAISEPFSTAGKINLNYAIAPFNYIRRATGIYGIMKSEEPLILPNEVAPIYKLWDHETNNFNGYNLPNSSSNLNAARNIPAQLKLRTDWGELYNGNPPCDKLRRAINMGETLKQFDARFAAGDIFRSATEICDMHLVRDNEQLTDYTGDKIWPKALITGENTRERPYANLYARLTTKSNVYTVHCRVQVLKKSRSTGVAEWDEEKDGVSSEYRGSSVIERYIDANDTKLPDFVSDATKRVDDFYKFRVLSTKKF